jgi:serine protease Do
VKIRNRLYPFGLLLVTFLSVHCADAQDNAVKRSSDSTRQNDASVIDIDQTRQNAITRAVGKVSPAVVGINVTQILRYEERSPFDQDPFWGWFFQPREAEQKVQSLGSGFIISAEGDIVTNAHVVAGAAEIIVTTTDGKQYKAKIVGMDETFDVALLKISAEKLPFIRLGDSDDVIIGEWVIALGNPFGLFDVNSKPTVTVGVVSAKGMSFKGSRSIEGKYYADMIQTDAAINGGNSGGPLVNGLGECIGMNAFIISGSEQKTSIGIGFAIPINRIKKVLPLIRKVGVVDRSFKVGMKVENLNWMAARMLHIRPDDGVIVSSIEQGGPAARAGVETGDVIVLVDEYRVPSVSQFLGYVNGLDVTESHHLKLKIYRDGKLIDRVLNLIETVKE